MLLGITDAMSSGQPAGPAGCGGMVIVLVVVLIAFALLGAAVWWMLRDIGMA